jgi:glucose/arabinose dehydrogenase
MSLRMLRTLVVAALAVLAGCAHETHKTPPAADKDEAEAEKNGAPPPEQPTMVQTPSGVQAVPSQALAGPPPKPLPTKIKIIVRSKPEKALVFWGRKKLGETPVTLERPRDSGPVDLIVRGDGFFPVHTRAYTFRTEVLYVKLTKLEDRMTLFGAKRDANEPPPGAVPDGGSPPTAAPPAAAPPVPLPAPATPAP